MKIVRRLPRLLKKAGFAVEIVMPSIITDVGNADFWRIEAYARLAPVAGILNEAETTAWREELLDASTRGEFFGSYVYYAYIARAT